MKILSKIRYRHRIAIAICVFALLPFMILSGFIVRKLWDDKVNAIIEENRSQLTVNTEAVNSLLSAGIQKLVFLCTNSTIYNYLEKGIFSDMSDNITEYDDLKKLVFALTVGDPNIRFTIYPLDNAVYNGNNIEKIERLEQQLQISSPEFLKKLLKLDWEGFLWHYDKMNNSDTSGLGSIYCFSKAQTVSKTLAITMFSINTKKVMGSMAASFPAGSMVVYRPDVQEDFVVIQDGSATGRGYKPGIVADLQNFGSDDYYLIEIKLNTSPGNVAVYIPRKFINVSLSGFLWITVLELAMIVVVLFFSIDLLSYFMTKRLTLLIDKVNSEVGNASFVSNMPKSKANDDIGKMEQKFYDMVENIQSSYQQALHLENGKKALELELLQSRINPHFLYNALSALRWNSNSREIIDIIDSMVSYYRMALGKGDIIVSIEHEMRLMEEYLKIQKYTYESDFTFEFAVEDNVKGAMIIKNLLQPIVENSVMHGIIGLKTDAVIKLAARCDGGTITLTIEDNGTGMSDDTARQLLDGDYKSKTGGYGIRNVLKRMNLFYGPECSLEIISALNEGTTFIVKVPVIQPGRPSVFV